MFEFRKVERDEPLMDEIYRLRYQVYVVEWGFERPEDHPDGRERDIYDENSVHFAAIRRDSGFLIGTVRLVLNSEQGFPIEKHCIFDKKMAPSERLFMGEISRLAVSKDYRRRATDNLMYEAENLTEEEAHQVANERRKVDNDIVVGLYRMIYRESLRRPVNHLSCVMARGLYVLLKRIGIDFQAAGPEIDYHGLRTPYIRRTDEVILRMAQVCPERYELFLTD